MVVVLGGVDLFPADGTEGAEEYDDGVAVEDGAARVDLQGGEGEEVKEDEKENMAEILGTERQEQAGDVGLLGTH